MGDRQGAIQPLQGIWEFQVPWEEARARWGCGPAAGRPGRQEWVPGNQASEPQQLRGSELLSTRIGSKDPFKD